MIILTILFKIVLGMIFMCLIILIALCIDMSLDEKRKSKAKIKQEKFNEQWVYLNPYVFDSLKKKEPELNLSGVTLNFKSASDVANYTDAVIICTASYNISETITKTILAAEFNLSELIQYNKESYIKS